MHKTITKTKLFANGRLNYSVKYHQFTTTVTDVDTGLQTKELFHEETVKYFQLPFEFGTQVQFGPCDDTGQYYR